MRGTAPQHSKAPPTRAAQEVLHARIEEEAQIDLARPRQHHDEGHQADGARPIVRMFEVPQSTWACCR